MWRSPATSDPGITPERLRTAEGEQWREGERAYDAETGRMCQTGLTQQAAQRLTPNVPNGGRSATHAIVKGRTLTREDGTKVQLGLEHQAKTWPTPRTITGGGETAERKKELGRTKAGGGDLQSAVENWPTPATRDFKGANSTEHVTTNGTGRMHMDQLPNFVEHAFRSSRPDPATPAGRTSSPERRTLNPLFVEWLMGWPIGWTGSAPVETASSHWWQAMRGELSRLGSRSTRQGTLL